jgi:beta-N-acetylhexosaminidase
MARLLVVVALLVSLLGAPPPAANAASCDASGSLADDFRQAPELRALAATVRALPLETKVGQLLMPGFVGTAPDAGLLDRVARGRVGGIFLLQRNVRSIEQLQALNGALSNAVAEATGGVRPFIATDFEGGPVNSLRVITGNTLSAAQLAFRGADSVRAQGAADAEALRFLGFNVDLAPVADVLTEASTVIGVRSFSSDPNAAALLSRAYLRGLHDGGVIGVMKHFPGHGATADDSHVMLPVVERSVEELLAADLVPYRQAIGAGELEAVMIGHLSIPALDPEMPASLSRATISGLLRDWLRFDGLVMTDELKMRAISEQYGVGEAATIALLAGVDVVLADWTGAEQAAVVGALVSACRSGAFGPGRIDRSVMRIMRLKLAYGLAGPEFEDAYSANLAEVGLPGLAPRAAAPPVEEIAPPDGDEMAPNAEAGVAPEGEQVGPGAEETVIEPGGAPAETPSPLPTTTPLPTPTPTPVSLQPTPTKPPTATVTVTATATATASPSATPTRTATRTP